MAVTDGVLILSISPSLSDCLNNSLVFYLLIFLVIVSIYDGSALSLAIFWDTYVKSTLSRTPKHYQVDS